MKCPMCGKGEVVCVGPWQPWSSSESPDNKFGLGFNMADGRTCCSLKYPKERGTREEMQALADSKSFRDWCIDNDMSWQDDEHDLIGSLDEGDPHDREPLSF